MRKKLSPKYLAAVRAELSEPPPLPILADTFKPNSIRGGADYAHHITTHPPLWIFRPPYGPAGG